MKKTTSRASAVLPALESSQLPLELAVRELANGLRVVVNPDTSYPLVAMNLWFGVGSKNDPPGRSGSAHLLEHLYYLAQPQTDPDDTYPARIQRLGGTCNASTLFDQTNYHCIVGPGDLLQSLKLEAERLEQPHKAITEERLAKQKGVVLNERRQTFTNHPYRQAFEAFHEQVFPQGHLYHRPVIGRTSEIEAIQLADLVRFAQLYYRPRQAVLTIAGAVQAEAVFEMAEQTVGQVHGLHPKPSATPDNSIDGESEAHSSPGTLPQRRGSLPTSSLSANVAQGRAFLGYLIPGFGEQEWYNAAMLSWMLSQGRSSRLRQRLVEDQQLATSLNAFVLPTLEASAFEIIATAAPGVSSTKLLEALRFEVEQLTAAPFSEADFVRAKRQLLVHYFRRVQSLPDRLRLLAEFGGYFKDPFRLRIEANRYMALGPQDLAQTVDGLNTRSRAVALTVDPLPTEAT